MNGYQEQATSGDAQNVNPIISIPQKRPRLTQERLKDLLDYNPETGIFTWKTTGSGRKAKSGNVAGTLHKSGYNVIRILGRGYYSHRLVWLYMEGFFPINIEIDHIDRDKENNRWKNLRLTSSSCNSRNRSIAKNNTSGVTGVGWRKDMYKWSASIRISDKLFHLGFFYDKSEAVKVRWEAEKKYGFPNCNTTSSAYLYLKERDLV